MESLTGLNKSVLPKFLPSDCMDEIVKTGQKYGLFNVVEVTTASKFFSDVQTTLQRCSETLSFVNQHASETLEPVVLKSAESGALGSCSEEFLESAISVMNKKTPTTELNVVSGLTNEEIGQLVAIKNKQELSQGKAKLEQAETLLLSKLKLQMKTIPNDIKGMFGNSANLKILLKLITLKEAGVTLNYETFNIVVSTR